MTICALERLGAMAAVYKLPIAHMACSTAEKGNFGWVGGSDKVARNVGAWNIRPASGVNVKNASTLKIETSATTRHQQRFLCAQLTEHCNVRQMPRPGRIEDLHAMKAMRSQVACCVPMTCSWINHKCCNASKIIQGGTRREQPHVNWAVTRVGPVRHPDITEPKEYGGGVMAMAAGRRPALRRAW